MSDNKQYIRDHYPLPVYNYKVTVYELGMLGLGVVGAGAAEMAFAEVSGLDISYDEVVYRNGLSELIGVNLIRGMMQPARITLRRGIVKKQTELADWMNFNWLEKLLDSTQHDLVIDLLQVEGEESRSVVSWKVMGALPLKLSAPNFDAQSNEVAIETLELVAREIQVQYN